MSSNFRRQQPNYVTKKNAFRQQIRRQYLDEYMSKKRAHCFGWPHQEYLNAHYLSQFTNCNYQVQIDKRNPSCLQRPFSQDLKPLYNQNYFNQTNLLEKITEISQQRQVSQSEDGTYEFRYKSFYEFLLNVIRQSLDLKYFDKFEDTRLFWEHFNALKQKVYQKVGQEIQNFLIQFYSVGGHILQESESSYEQSMSQKCRRLIYQLENFIQSSSLQVQQLHQWPLISVEEQLIFLLKILIEITYYDQPIQTESILDVINRTQNSQINHKYLQIFELESSQEEQPLNSTPSKSVTQYFLNEGSLLQRIKFLIVFGHSEHNISQQYQSSFSYSKLPSTQKNRKHREIKFILHFLSNIAFNIGSDFLFKTSIIGELKFLLSEPSESSFTVDIRSKPRIHSISKIHQHIIYFILNAFQMVKTQSSLDQLSNIDSLNFVFEALVKATMAKRELELAAQYQNKNLSVGNQFLLLECDDQNHEDEVNLDESFDEMSGQKNTLSHGQINGLTRLGQKCIECIEFHLALGSNLSPNQYQYKPKLQNRYLLKLKYLLRTDVDDCVLTDYASGRQLVKRLSIIQN